MFGKKKPAHVLWLERLGVSSQLRMELERFVADPDFLAQNLSLFSSRGPDVVFPLLTVAPFVSADVRFLVCGVIRRAGDSSAPALMAILHEVLFEDYRRVLRQSGLAEIGAMHEARLHSRQVYGNALDGLAELVGIAHAVRPWFSAARSVALHYRHSSEIVLSGPANALIAWIDRELMFASGTVTAAGLLGEREISPKFAGEKIDDTGWGRTELEYQRQLRQMSAREQQHARDLEAAAALLWINQQRTKED